MKEGAKDGKAKRPKHNLAEITCFKCGLKGHFVSKCPDGKKPNEVSSSEHIEFMHPIVSHSQEAFVSQQVVGLEVASQEAVTEVAAKPVAEPRLPYKRGKAAMQGFELCSIVSEGGFEA